jgi:hypothetical protein
VQQAIELREDLAMADEASGAIFRQRFAVCDRLRENTTRQGLANEYRPKAPKSRQCKS